MSFFTNGGAEANENAIKLARWYTGRHKIIARYRSYHGATGGAITLTGDPRRWPAEPGLPGVVRMFDPVHLSLPGRPSRPVPGLHRRPAPRGDPPVRGRAHRRRGDPRDGHRHERDHRPARRLSAVDPRGLRPARDPADLRRGDGRLRPHRQVVRRRQLGRRPRHPDRREGHQLGLRPAGRDGRARADRRLGARQDVRRRAHLQRASARVRVGGRIDRGVPGGGHRRAGRRDRRGVPRRSSRSSRRSIRRSARCAGSAASGDSSSSRTATTREPLVPFNGGGRRREADGAP